MLSNKRFLGLVLAGVATLCWASFYIVSRFAFGESATAIDPVYFSFLRFVFASAFFLAVLAWQGKLSKAAEAFRLDWKLLSMLALTGIALQGILVFWALKYTTAARGSLFANAAPIFTALIAFFVLGERLGWKGFLGMGLGFAGAAVAIMRGGGGDAYAQSDGVIIGDLLALGSGVFWAIYTVWGAKATARHGSLVSTAIAILVGTAMLFALTLAFGCPLELDFGWKLWLATAYLGIFGCGLAFLCWYAALKYLKAGEVGAFGYMSAALAALMSFLFLRESFSIWFFLALAAIVAGVWLMMDGQAKSGGTASLDE